MTATYEYEQVTVEGITGSSRKFKLACGHWVGPGEQAIHIYRNHTTSPVTVCEQCGSTWVKRMKAHQLLD